MPRSARCRDPDLAARRRCRRVDGRRAVHTERHLPSVRRPDGTGRRKPVTDVDGEPIGDVSVVTHIGDDERCLPIGCWLSPFCAVHVHKVVRAVALHLPVGEASAIRREGRTELMDAIRLAADDASRLLVEPREPDVGVGIDAGRVCLHDAERDPAIGRR